MTSTAVAAIARIQEIQARQKTFKGPAPTKELASVGSSRLANHLSRDNKSSRMLPSGYVSGGRVGTESDSELLRLSGIVDSLSEKIKAQLHKLERTEASLIKANQQITNERASGQARLMKANEHIRKLTESEAKLKSVASIIRADQARSDETFQSSIKKFQESEDKMQEQRSQLDTMAQTNKAFSDQISKLQTDLSNVSLERDASRGALEESEAKCTGLLARIDELTFESKTASGNSVATENASMRAIQDELEASRSETEKIRTEIELQRINMGSSLESLTKDRDALSAKLEETTKRLGSDLATMKEERDEIGASVASLVSNKEAATAELSVVTRKLSDAERQRDDALKLLESSRRALKQATNEPAVDVEKLTSDLSITQSTLRTSEQQRMQMSSRISLLESEMQSSITGQFKLKELESFDEWAANQPFHSTTHVTRYSSTGARSDTRDYKASSYKPTQPASKNVRTVVFERAKRWDSTSASSPGLSVCVANARRGYESKRFFCDGHAYGRFRPNMLSRGDVLSTKENVDGNKLLESLVVAVSKDVVSAIVDARRSYMLASGMDEEDADQQLMPFAVAPIGREEDRE
jgi:DNA repair exonuclease SbcCD ATPase subunit